jgi:hypothetical protein
VGSLEWLLRIRLHQSLHPAGSVLHPYSCLDWHVAGVDRLR